MQRDRRRGVWRLALAAALYAAVVSAEPTTVRCGPTHAMCGPAIVGTGGGGAITAAPSWATSVYAAWMLDEGAGTTRVNLQGTTGRNLVEGGGTVANNTTTKMEGTAAADMPGGATFLGTSDATLENIPAPFSCGLWVRTTATSTLVLRGNSTSPANGMDILSTGGYSFRLWTAGAIDTLVGPFIANNIWTHVVIRQQGTDSRVYYNGAQVAQKTRTYTQPGAGGTINWFTLGAGSTSFTGQLDEAWCTMAALADTSICRICSCGIRGEQCTCSGTAFATTGRNASACGSCTLPSDCTAATPP